MVKFGLIGFGLAAKVFHLPILTRMPDALVTSVFSSKPMQEVQQTLPGVAVYNELARFFAEADVDVVLVLTPNDIHHDIARQALLHDKHVIIDKPFAVSSQQCDELIQLATQRQRLLTVYHNRRWDGDFLTVQKLLSSQQLGTLSYVESRFDKYRPKVWGRWREQARPGAGLLCDLGSHLIDQALVLFGQPHTVYAQVLTQRAQAQTEDYFHLMLNYPGRQVVLRGSSLARVTPFRFYLEGSDGVFIKKDQDIQEKQMADNMSPFDDAWGIDPPANYGVLDLNMEGKTSQLLATERGCYQQFYLNFLAACRGEAALHVLPEQARDVVRMIELARMSSAQGREVRID